MKLVSSRDNPRFKQLRRWAEKGRARREAGVLLLDGLHLVEALLAAGGELVEIVVSQSGAERREIRDWLGRHAGLAVLGLPDALFAEIVSTESPAGLLAVARLPAQATDISPQRDSLLLDGVQDPGNIGTLLRTAAAAGIRQALLAPGCADPWAPKCLRAGQGAQFELAIHENADLAAFLGQFHGQGIVTRLDAERSLYDLVLTGPLAWVFGAEGLGVSAAVAAAAGTGIRIPMPGRVESLNVGAAAAVCLFEMVRQRSDRANCATGKTGR